MADPFITLLKAHQAVYERTGGLFGHRLLFGMPSLLLYSVGRKTGQPRTSALIYGRDGDSYLVTASNGGAKRPPGWLPNVKAQPQCEIQIGRKKIPVTAEAIYPDDPRFEKLWDEVNRANHGQYRKYQENTTRRIPVVRLTPR